MESQKVKMFDGGKLVIPAAYRRSMGIGPGDTLIVELDDGELRIRSLPAIIRQAQELVRKFNPRKKSMVDDLIEDRRIEAQGE